MLKCVWHAWQKHTLSPALLFIHYVLTLSMLTGLLCCRQVNGYPSSPFSMTPFVFKKTHKPLEPLPSSFNKPCNSASFPS